MSRPRYTTEQKRELVLECLAVPYGKRSRWLDERGIPNRSFHLWRQQMVAGGLEKGMIPRGGVWVSVEENKEMGRLHAENKALRTDLEKAKERALTQDRTIEVLGKVFGSSGEEARSGLKMGVRSPADVVSLWSREAVEK